VGNLGIDLFIAPLASIFGLELALKLIVLPIPPVTVLGSVLDWWTNDAVLCRVEHRLTPRPNRIKNEALVVLHPL